MGPVLQGLMALQSVENRLRAIKSKLTRCRRRVIFQENKLRSLQSELAAKKEEIKMTQVQADRLELEIRNRDEHIAKYRAALNTAKTNKEYASILTELNTSKADNSKIESQVLDLMNNIETDKSACEDIQQQIEEQNAVVDDIRKDSEAEASKYETQIAEIQAEWDQVAKDVAPNALEIFKRVAETYDGEAIAEVENQNGSYNCSGCYMRIPAEVVNQLMTKDDIIRCSNCTRILVFHDK